MVNTVPISQDYFVAGLGATTYPIGNGASSTTAEDSIFATDGRFVVYGMLIRGVAANALVTVEDHAGTDLFLMYCPSSTRYMEFSFSGSAGLRITTDANAYVVCFYGDRRVTR